MTSLGTGCCPPGHPDVFPFRGGKVQDLAGRVLSNGRRKSVSALPPVEVRAADAFQQRPTQIF